MLMKKSEKGKNRVLDRIKTEHDNFTPAQKAIAEYILHNPESLLFMSINELAEATKVSMASIVRFCNVLGFDGYTQFSKEIQEMLQGQLSTSGRFRIAQSNRAVSENRKLSTWGDSAFSRILGHEIENLNRLAENVRVEDFNALAKMILEADRIITLGCMASASLAGHMGRMLCKVFHEVDVVDNEGVLNAAKFLRLTPESVVFVIAFPRYPAATVRMGKAAADMACRVVSLTDSHLSPSSGLGELTFHIPVGIPSFVDAYAAPLTFINALCTEVAEVNSERATESLNAFDALASKGKIFYKQTWRGRPRNSE